VDQQTVASTDISLSHEVASDRDSQSGDSEESESGSDTATCLMVAVVAALAGVTYDFGREVSFMPLCVALVESKSITPAFDRSTGEGRLTTV
jgi:FlaG/FlaF family flagellin (archaellin)